MAQTVLEGATGTDGHRSPPDGAWIKIPDGGDHRQGALSTGIRTRERFDLPGARLLSTATRGVRLSSRVRPCSSYESPGLSGCGKAAGSSDEERRI
jgi:hypothetical protein